MSKRRKKNLTDFGEKVQNILSERNITQAQLGELTNLSQSTINGMLSRTNIGYETMLKAANALGYEISLELSPIVEKKDLDTDIVTIPVSIVAAGAGTSTLFRSDDAFENKDFPTEIVPQNADCGVRISGDSMSPKYPDGCIVWVKKNVELQYGDEAIVILNGCPFFKIVEQDGLHSLNPKYLPIKIYETDSFFQFGKVVGSYQEDV